MAANGDELSGWQPGGLVASRKSTFQRHDKKMRLSTRKNLLRSSVLYETIVV